MTSAAPFAMARLNALAELCAADAYFVEHACGFNATVLLRRDQEHGSLKISSSTGTDPGMVRVTAAEGQPESWAVGIFGTSQQWQVIWNGLPGGLHRAWRQKLLEFAGSQQMLLAHYPMIWQLGELMVRSGWAD